MDFGIFHISHFIFIYESLLMLEDFFIEFLQLKNSRETFATAMVVQHGTPI